MIRARHTARPWLWLVFVALSLGLISAACADDDNGETQTPTANGPGSSPGVTATPGGSGAIPPEIAGNLGEWPLPNAGYENTRYAESATIDSENVDDLGVAWTVPATGTGPFGSLATNPVLADGVVYFQDLGSNVYAVDADSGDEIWKNEVNRVSVGPNGVALGYGRVYYVSGMDTLVAVDAQTGDELWSRPLPVSDIEGADIQPIVYDGNILMSTIPGAGPESFYEGGARGILYVFDAESGDEVWSFDTIESEDLWGHPDVNSGGGAWYPPAVDTETGMTYWGVGNPAPYPGTEEWPEGTSRPGDNLYTNSILAMNAEGELEWHHQAKPHDLFDLDYQSSPILTSIEMDGETRDIVIGSGKLGRVIAYDRDSGEVLWDTSVGEHQNDELQDLPDGEETVVLPGTYGGVETPLAYYDGIVYAVTLNWSTTYTPTSLTHEFDPGRANSNVVAIDVASGEVVWQTNQTGLSLGGATVVNDLVFTALYDGNIYAYDRETGDEVWNMQFPVGVNGWPAVVDDTIYWPAGVGNNPMMIALRLGADEGFPTPEPSPDGTPADGTETPETTPTPEGTPDADGTPSPTATDDGNGEDVVERTSVTEDIAFEENTITVPAGSSVEITLINEDSVPHNIAFYRTDEAEEEIFVGTIITGPDEQITETFSAPSEPGEYFFRCDVHPVTMVGTFIVE